MAGLPSSKTLSRRTVLAATAAAGTAVLARDASAGQACPLGPPPHEEGPRVFLDYDQVELDAVYDQSFYAPLAGQIMNRLAARSEDTRTRLGAPRRLSAYWPTPGSKASISIAPTAQDNEYSSSSTAAHDAARIGEGIRLC